MHRYSVFSKLLTILGAAVFFAAFESTLHAQALKADYQFQGNLDSSVAGAPAMQNLTGAAGANSFQNDTVDGYSRQSLRFPKDSGVSVNTAGLIPNDAYTAVILFRMDELDGYRRIIDAMGGLQDNCGGYINNSRFDGESQTNTNANPILWPQLYTQVVIVREASGRVRAFREGRVKLDVANDSGCFQISSNLLRFFQDDTEAGGEASAGNVARIRLYDAPMTDSQVRALDRVENAVGGGDQAMLFQSDRDGNFEIYSMNADGTNQRRLTQNDVTDAYPNWSPANQKIVFATRRDGNDWEIYTMNIDGSDPTRLTNVPGIDFRPTWSPDGSKILFSRCYANSNCNLWVMSADGSGQTALTNTPDTLDNDMAQWWPDGSKIIFSSSRDAATYEIYVMNADGSNVVRLTNNAQNDYYPSVSPSGSKIAYVGFPGGGLGEIFMMNADGSGQVNITNTPSEDLYPVWSPDGGKLAFSTYRYTGLPDTHAGSEIQVANPDGSGIFRLTYNNRNDEIFDWRAQAQSCQNGVAVSLPSVNAFRTATVTVPVAVGDTTGRNITSFDLDLRFDPSIVRLAASGAFDKSGTLTAGFDITTNTSTPGQLLVSGFGVSPLAGAGTLVNLTFEVVGNPSQVAALNIQGFQFNEGDPCATVSNGQVTVNGGSIAGTVNYYFAGSGQPQAVPNVILSAAGSTQSSATTNASGAYLLTNLGTNIVIVTASKTGEVNGSITSQDAALVAQSAVGLVTLTADQRIAADVTGNGVVTSQDAARIAQYAAGLPVSGSIGQWRFVPPSRNYGPVNSNITGQDYEAVLVGDVTGNWAAAGSRQAVAKSKAARNLGAGAVTVSLPAISARRGAVVNVPVTVGNLAGLNVTSFDLEVGFDPAVLQPVALAPTTNSGTLSGSFTITPNPNVAGKIVISGYGIEPLAGDGTLLNLNFNVVGTSGANSSITWQKAVFNEGDPGTTSNAGQVSVSAGIARPTSFDFDGDGKADLGVFRRSDSNWYSLESAEGFGVRQFGVGTDKLTPADFDGDGKTDLSVFRPSSGTWYYIGSLAGSFVVINWGAEGDLPVPADFDGDGRADFAVYRPSNATWYIRSSANGAISVTQFGAAGDKPQIGDFDGDGKADLAVFRPSDSTWYFQTQTKGFFSFPWGAAGDIPAPADFDGDGTTDMAVFRPSTGNWYIIGADRSIRKLSWGVEGDIPAPADYDGDGKADASVFRPSNGTWYRMMSTDGISVTQYGVAGDDPLPASFIF
jgi:Tol biopolymer transport system component